MARPKLHISLSKSGDWDVVKFSGSVDENGSLEFPAIANKVGKRVRFDFHEVTAINSSGVRAWINFFRDFKKDREVIFQELPPTVVVQLNMIPSFYEGAPVDSVYGNFFCENCGHQELVRFSRDDGMPDSATNIEGRPCPKCQSEMDFEEDDSFFAFNDPPD